MDTGTPTKGAKETTESNSNQRTHPTVVRYFKLFEPFVFVKVCGEMIIILENPQKVLFKHKVSVPRDFIRDIQYLPHYLSGDKEKI